MGFFSLPLLVTILKITVAVFSLMTIGLTGGFLSKWNDPGSSFPGIGSIYVSHPGANGLIAAMVFNLVYHLYYLAFYFIRPSSIFICMIVDVSWTGFLFIFSLGATGAMTASTSSYGICSGSASAPWCGLGQASTAFGWLTTFLLLGLLVFQVTYTLMRCGMDIDTWRTPFNELLQYGSTSSSKRAGSGKSSPAGMEAGYAYGNPQQGSMPQHVQQQREQQQRETHHYAQGSGYAPVATNQAQVQQAYQQYPIPMQQTQGFQPQSHQYRQ